MLQKTRSLWILLALTTCAYGQFEPITFGHRYRDQLNGFSLRPPDRAKKITGGTATRLVSWQVRDPETDAVAWQLTVQQLRAEQAKADLKAYAEKLKQTFQADERFTVESFEIGSLAGKTALHITGASQVGKVRFWQRQVRILAEEGRLLIFTVSGPPSQKNRLSDLGLQIFKTIQLTDPEEYRKRHARNLQRAKDLLDQLDEEQILSALQDDRQWFKLSLKGKDIGWMVQEERRESEQGFDGICVTSWAQMDLPGAPSRRMHRRLFCATDRKYETWQELLQVGSGPQTQIRFEDGLKRRDAVAVDILLHNKLRTFTRKAPDQIEGIYLPKALEALVHRLIDIQSGGGYIFATYEAGKNGFNMHMLNLESVRRINVDGRSVVATGLTQQKHYDAPVSKVWIDEKGRLLKLESEDDFAIERAGREEILKRWPRVGVSIEQISAQRKIQQKNLLNKLPGSKKQ
jgi:hypothetical protein